MALDQHRWDLNDSAHALAGSLSNADYGPGMPWAKAMLPDASEGVLRTLARRLIEARLEATKAELVALNGAPLVMPALAPLPAPASQGAPKETPRVSTVATLYGDERVGGGFWTAKTEHQNRTILALLANLMGDPPIGSVTKETIRQLGHDVLRLPSNVTKRFPGMSPRAVLEMLEGDTSTPRLEPRSINKYRQLIRTLFSWSQDQDFITTNPATILQDVKEGRAREDRKEFTDEDLRVYFSGLPQSIEPQAFLY